MISEFLSSGVLVCFPGFRVVRPGFLTSDFRSSRFRSSRFQISEFQISESQISELQFSEFQVSELQVSEFLISEFLSSELLRSRAPTSQLTSSIAQEAVELANTTKTVVSEFLSSRVLAFLVSELCVPNFRSSWPRIFGAPSFGAPNFGVPDFGVPDFGIPDFGAPDFGVPDFGAPGFGAPKFGAPSFGIPQVRSSNFSTHELDCSGSSGVGRHYKNSGFGIFEFKSFGFPGFRVARPGFSEFLTSDFRTSWPEEFGHLRFGNFSIARASFLDIDHCRALPELNPTSSGWATTSGGTLAENKRSLKGAWSLKRWGYAVKPDRIDVLIVALWKR